MPSPECPYINSSRWAHEEIVLLIKLWMNYSINKKFDGTSRDFLVHTEIANALKANGFRKNPHQVRLKIKNLKRDYKTTLRKRRTSGGRVISTFRYFYEIDEFLRGSPHTVSTPTVIYMDQEIAAAKNTTDEESLDTGSLIPTVSSSDSVDRLAFEAQDDCGVESSEIQAATPTSSDEESVDCSAVVPIVTKPSDNANSDHALYAAKEDGGNASSEDVPSFTFKRTSKESKSRLSEMEDILNRVLGSTLDKFMKFERRVEEQNRADTNSFRNEVLALERKKLEESVTQTLQNDRLICLMESLVSSSH